MCSREVPQRGECETSGVRGAGLIRYQWAVATYLAAASDILWSVSHTSHAQMMVGHCRTGSETYERRRVSGHNRSLYNKERICESGQCAHLVCLVLSAPSLASRNGPIWQRLERGRINRSGSCKACGVDLVICTLDPCRSGPPIPRLPTPSSEAMRSGT